MRLHMDAMTRALASAWPHPARLNLPKRVYAAIRENDNSSEVLVKLIQLIVFSLWGVAYVAAPAPNPDTTSAVPLVILLYLTLTLIGLFIALGKNPSNRLIYPSIVLDMVLLTYLIWSFHIQYDQEASFSLKAVEFYNYFILVGLRSLRFQSRYVIAAGLSAILCWSALLIYVVYTDPADPMITKSYITYLTSNTVLIGAEISKMIALLMFTIILAVAVRRGQSFLINSIAEEKAATDLSRFMADSVASQIRGAEVEFQAGQGERRDVAILNIDIRGFTQLVADMDSGDAMKLLSDYQHQIVPIVHRHGGVVDKYMGDGIMTTFGTSAADEVPCANALRCVEDILKSQKNWTGDLGMLQINLAVAAGPVIYGAVGDGDRLELTVIGPSVNRSAKLEKHNKELGSTAVAGSICYDLAIEQGYRAKTHHRRIKTRLADDQQDSEVVILA